MNKKLTKLILTNIAKSLLQRHLVSIAIEEYLSSLEVIAIIHRALAISYRAFTDIYRAVVNIHRA